MVGAVTSKRAYRRGVFCCVVRCFLVCGDCLEPPLTLKTWTHWCGQRLCSQGLVYHGYVHLTYTKKVVVQKRGETHFILLMWRRFEHVIFQGHMDWLNKFE